MHADQHSHKHAYMHTDMHVHTHLHIFKDQVCDLCLDMKGFLPHTLQSECEGCFWVDHSTLMVRRTLFSHRICGWGIKSPTTPPAPDIHPPTLPAPDTFFYSQSHFKYLTLHQPLCVSAQRRLTRRYPIDALGKPSVFWMCQNWLGFQSGCKCKCKRYLFSPLTPANSCTHWGLVVGNLIPFEEQDPQMPRPSLTVVEQGQNGWRTFSLLSNSCYRLLW